MLMDRLNEYLDHQRMPYVSKAQEAYFNANRDKLEAQGVNVDEWNEASKGMKLPKRAETNRSRLIRALASSPGQHQRG